MVTKPMASSLYEKGRQARHFIVRIWTKTTGRQASGSYENLTEDRDPSAAAGPCKERPSKQEDLQLEEVQPWHGAIVGSDTGARQGSDIRESQLSRRIDSSGYDPFGSTVSGFAALGLAPSNVDLHPVGATMASCHSSGQDESSHSRGPAQSPRTTYFYDSMVSLKKESSEDDHQQHGEEHVPQLSLQTQEDGTDTQPDSTNDIQSTGRSDGEPTQLSGLRFDDKDWQLYYGKKGKKKLRKKVILQVNRGERTLAKECYVELEENGEEGGERKRRTKKKRVRASKAKKRARRVGAITTCEHL